MIKKYIFIVFIVCSIIFSSCSQQTSKSDILDESRITVYTSFYAMYDFTNKLGGEKINIINLVPSGTEPHDWEPSPSDIVNLEKADVFIYSGAGMESWTDKVLQTIENKSLTVVEASKDIKFIESKDSSEMEYDPHIWLNPLLAKEQMKAIKEGLIAADPVNKDYYENNYLIHAEKMDELDKAFKDTLAPFTKRDIIVAHDAYGYLCEAYELNQIPIEGLSADSEPSPGRMSEIIQFAKDNDIKTIFFEELVSPKVAETIANEIGAQTAILSPLEGIKEEDLQKGKEYYSVMKENLEALVKALE